MISLSSNGSVISLLLCMSILVIGTSSIYWLEITLPSHVPVVIFPFKTISLLIVKLENVGEESVVKSWFKYVSFSIYNFLSDAKKSILPFPLK